MRKKLCGDKMSPAALWECSGPSEMVHSSHAHAWKEAGQLGKYNPPDYMVDLQDNWTNSQDFGSVPWHVLLT